MPEYKLLLYITLEFCIFKSIHILKIEYNCIMSNTKLNVAIVSAMLLLATAIVAIPLKAASAQQQLSTQTNQSASTNQSGINVDQQISELKSKFPLLNTSEGTEVKDIIHKIQGLDKQQALKTLAAFHTLRNLHEYKELLGANNSTG